MWYGSTEVKPERTEVTLFPSQTEGLRTHTHGDLCVLQKRWFLTWKRGFVSDTMTAQREVAPCSGRQETDIAAGFWSNIPIKETLPDWFLSFLGQVKHIISKFCTSIDKWGELVHQSLPESPSLALKSDLCYAQHQPQLPALAKRLHSLWQE